MVPYLAFASDDHKALFARNLVNLEELDTGSRLKGRPGIPWRRIVVVIRNVLEVL